MKKMNRIARSATTAVAIATGVAMFTAPRRRARITRGR